MPNAELMVDAITLAGVLAMLACPILAIALYATGSIAWRQAKKRREAEDAVRSLNRRLEDVEHLRELDAQRLIRKPQDRGCTVPPKGWRCTRKAGHEGPCAALPDGEPGSFTNRDAPKIMRGEEPNRIIREHLGEMP